MPIYTCRYMFKMCGWWYEGVEFFFCLFLFCLKPTLTDFFGHLGPLQDNKLNKQAEFTVLSSGLDPFVAPTQISKHPHI